jgi:hypothetical protein
MDDNVWEYPFGDLDDDDDLFFRNPQALPSERERPGSQC